MPRIFELVGGATAPDFPKMMLANVIALKALGGQAHIYDIEKKVIEIEEMDAVEQSHRTTNGTTTKLNYYLGWARTYLRYAGALESVAYGTWALTGAGHQIGNLQDAEATYGIYIERLAQNNREKLEEERLANNNNEELPDADEEIAPDDVVWRGNLLEILGLIRPDAFEKLSYQLLFKAGFINVEVVGKGADRGIDGWGTLQNELISVNICFQCKRWQNKVGSPQIRNFRGAIQGRVDKGLFLTTSRYTSHAITEATRDGAIPIDLIDGNRLCDLLKQYNLGVETLHGGRIRIQNLDYFNNLTPNPQQQGN